MQLAEAAREHAAAASPDFADVVRRRRRRNRRSITTAVAGAAMALAAALVVVPQVSDRQAQDQLQPARTDPRTVHFDLTYIGVDFERQNASEGLQRCLRQPGTAVTRSGDGIPPIEQVSVTGDRDAVRSFEQCLQLVLNTRVDRVPQQVDGTKAEEPARSLADRYNTAPPYPGDPWTKNGREVPPDELNLTAGPAHCDWQESASLGGTALKAPRDQVGAHWVRDPQGVLDFDPRLQAEFQPRAELPADAVWTGYAQDGVELWVAPSDNAAYVYLVNTANRADTERWVRGGAFCA
jgi:hypothetical protein